MSKLLSLVALSAIVASANAGGAVDITESNFATSINGRNAFIKFMAPWCGHCKKLKPIWDQLGDEFSASLSVLIGDVDCTRADDLLCKYQKVEQYPMLKVYYSGDTEGFEYQGDEDIDTLRAFIESHLLEGKCKVSQFETDGNCSPKEREYIVTMKGGSTEYRYKQIERLENMAGDPMTPELRLWVRQRLHILRSIEGKDEL